MKFQTHFVPEVTSNRKLFRQFSEFFFFFNIKLSFFKSLNLSFLKSSVGKEE